MVISDHNQPVHCNGIALLSYKIKASYVRTTEREKSSNRYYMGYLCYWVDDKFIRHWVVLPMKKTLKRTKPIKVFINIKIQM